MANPDGATIEERIEAALYPEPEQPEEQPEIEAAEVEGDDAPAEVEEETEVTEDTEAPQETDAEQEVTFQTLAELLEAGEVNADNLKTTIKVDGQEQEITLSELQSGYQRDADYRRKTMELADKRRDWEQRIEQINQLGQQLYQQAQVDPYAQAEQQLNAEYAQVNWNELRMTDPAEYAATHAEFQNRMNGINQQRQMYQQQVQQASQQMQQANHQRMSETLQREHEALVAANPAFSDQAAVKRVSESLQGYGFKPEELSSVYDHRIVLLAEDARQWREHQARLKTAKAKVADKPKVLKPGKRVTSAETSTRRSQELRGRLKKSGSVRDLEAVLLDRM